MQCNFQVGQKVVCVSVDGGPPDGYHVLQRVILPEVGKVYTVREIMVGKVGNAPCVTLHEIPAQSVEVLVGRSLRVGNIIFHASIFRPVVEPGTETGMSILRELLNTQDKPLEVVS